MLHVLVFSFFPSPLGPLGILRKRFSLLVCFHHCCVSISLFTVNTYCGIKEEATVAAVLTCLLVLSKEVSGVPF